MQFPPPGDLPDQWMEPGSLTLQADSLPSEPPGKPLFYAKIKTAWNKRMESPWGYNVWRERRGQRWRHRHREQACGHRVGKERVRQIEGVHWKYIPYHMRDSQWEFAEQRRELNLVLWDNLDGWDGVGGGRWKEGSRERGHIHSCWCMAETNTYCKSIIHQF